eukprot:scaffold16492_cov90-Isochrysis_galbana.AAC.2
MGQARAEIATPAKEQRRPGGGVRASCGSGDKCTRCTGARDGHRDAMGWLCCRSAPSGGQNRHRTPQHSSRPPAHATPSCPNRAQPTPQPPPIRPPACTRWPHHTPPPAHSHTAAFHSACGVDLAWAFSDRPSLAWSPNRA